jgi:hypothetical protein
MDLHRRRSVLVRMSETGEHLETVRISNDPEYLRQVMARAGEAPEVVLEAAYGWYWAADTLAEGGNSWDALQRFHDAGVDVVSDGELRGYEVESDGNVEDFVGVTITANTATPDSATVMAGRIVTAITSQAALNTSPLYQAVSASQDGTSVTIIGSAFSPVVSTSSP